MRFVIVIILVLGLLLGVLLPSYLAPDALRGCNGPSTSGPCEGGDAIVAISGGDTVARTDEAVKLYKAGWAKTLIFSGAASDPSSPSNAKVMRKTALKDGVPDASIIIEEDAKTTYENAQNSAKIFEGRNMKRIILVTSGYHERRAELVFTKAAPETQIVPHPVSSDDQWSNWWWVTPVGWWLSSTELLKIAGFYLGLGT